METEKKIAVVIKNDLLNWQKLNVTSFLASSIANEPTPTQGYGVSMGNNLMIDSRVGAPGQGN